MGKLTDRIVDHLQGIEDLKEKMRKVFWLQLDYYERHVGLGRIVFMTLPMNTWMGDKTFAQPRMMGLMIDVLRQGQKEGVLNSRCQSWYAARFPDGICPAQFFHVDTSGPERKPCRPRQTLMFEMVWKRHDRSRASGKWKRVIFPSTIDLKRQL